MRKLHQKNTVRYFLIVIALLFFLFLSGDFGLVDVQKTAIVMAVGIDREEDAFIVTSQIAVPKASDSGKSSETVQIVSRGKTVADAFEEINAKTGWYPKLVFCRLILLGEKTAQNNVFDALDFFLLDEYISDNCLLATCDGQAKDLLNVKALVDASGSVAIQKILSSHAQRVGTVLPTTLREFSIGYYSESKSAFMPVLKTQPQQDPVDDTSPNPPNGAAPSAATQAQTSAQENGGKNAENKDEEKPIFSAGETALFYAGKRVATLTEEETFAFNAVKNKLRLAAYSVETNEGAYTLSLKRNSPKTVCTLGKNGRVSYQIHVKISAGLLDSANAFSKTEGIDGGDTPPSAYQAAEKLLAAQISSTFEKSRVSGCDLFGLLETLQKRENKRFESVKTTALENAALTVRVQFQNIR
ncbi:MAG: hypothetical protein E7355_02360 [Clostridiales bacterium]|nr:hypothetical protein [Clostridiales bacterium]